MQTQLSALFMFLLPCTHPRLFIFPVLRPSTLCFVIHAPSLPLSTPVISSICPSRLHLSFPPTIPLLCLSVRWTVLQLVWTHEAAVYHWGHFIRTSHTEHTHTFIQCYIDRYAVTAPVFLICCCNHAWHSICHCILPKKMTHNTYTLQYTILHWTHHPEHFIFRLTGNAD